MNFFKKLLQSFQETQKAVKMNLIIIDLDMASEIQTSQFIPGQKLCKNCYAKFKSNAKENSRSFSDMF